LLFNPGLAIEAASLIIKKTVPFWRSFIQEFRVVFLLKFDSAAFDRLKP
jgi:hypothetical protein